MPPNAERASPVGLARHDQLPAQATAPRSPVTVAQNVVHPDELAAVLDLSDERDRWERLADRAYRDGYRQAEHDHADDYERGRSDGALDRKRAQHDIVDMARTDVARWGPGGRERFADSCDGDYPGGPAGVAKVRAAWLAAGLSLGPGPGWVHLGGPVVHWHRPCTAACHAYKPGWHAIADAIAILATLPGEYAAVLAELRAIPDEAATQMEAA